MLNGQSEPINRENEPLPGPLFCRGVRGATTAVANDSETILAATRELLFAMIHYNGIEPADVASAYFTTTVDLTAVYPAIAARQLGWYDVPLLCGHEMQVPNGLLQCIRVLIHWNCRKAQTDIVHVYLHEATSLRPDKGTLPPIPSEELARYMAGMGNPVP